MITVTIPLDYYLLLSIKRNLVRTNGDGCFFAVIDNDFRQQIISQIGWESVCYLEPSPPPDGQPDPGLWRLWPLADWQASTEKRKRLEAESTQRIAAFDAAQAKINRAIARLVKIGKTEKQAREIINQIDSYPKLKEKLEL